MGRPSIRRRSTRRWSCRPPSGSGTLTFANADNGTFAYTVNGVTQSKPITRQVFGPLPTCRFGMQADLAAAKQLSGPVVECAGGIGIRLGPEHSRIKATRCSSPGSPTTSTARRCGCPRRRKKPVATAYAGTLYRTSGPPFSATPWNPAAVTITPVGTVTLTFADGNHATFAYTVDAVSQTKQITRQVFRTPGTVCN